MTQILERMVEDAIEIRERRQSASSLHNWLKSRLDKVEDDIEERLHKRDAVRIESGLYAVLDHQQINRASYIDVINKFCEQHPEYLGEFDQMICEQKSRLVEAVEYGRLEDKGYKKP